MSLWNKLLDLLYPPKCGFCRKLLDGDERGICRSCRKSLPYTGSDARKQVEFMTTAVAALRYDDRVRSSVLRYKFHGVTALADVYAPLLAETIDRELHGAYDIVTWAPLSRKRLRRRGYDQARLLAEKTAACLGTEAVPLLDKVRNVRAQSGLQDAGLRKANISGCYAVKAGAGVARQRILIIDDVVTTGATLSECARVLMLAGAESVAGAALARAR